MKPFLLITSRADDTLVYPEVNSYRKLTGLTGEGELAWLRAEQSEIAGIDLAEYSGIILAGSPFTVSNSDAQKTVTELRVEREFAALLDGVVALDYPFLGICYGVGTLGNHQGAVVSNTNGEDIQVITVQLTAAGEADPLFAGVSTVFDAYVGHKEALLAAPAHFSVLASGENCPVQAFKVGQNVYATQFHPELEPETFKQRIYAYRDHGYFDPATIDDLLAQIAAADVVASQRVLKNFVRLYAT
ncbi:glutamine amidotransferase [Canibacter sp. lx-45]|uniref:glutamine amidotransferase n=1 Tax=Canibacter zhuwentaonis TaxID=2837491 RepID=UPI001BDCEA99|nr:glutamine amidotransferase [Canibacter zhuwentaonis]MBT1035614.1 glutamine amidotransferase [Canibacter zhuwentaonis]